LHLQTGQRLKDKEAVTLRQRFKKLFRLELAKAHQANPQRKSIALANKAKRQRIKKRSRRLELAKVHTQPYGVRMYLDGIITRFWVIVIVF
jgi:hypothetical protein